MDYHQPQDMNVSCRGNELIRSLDFGVILYIQHGMKYEVGFSNVYKGGKSVFRNMLHDLGLFD